MLKKIIIICLIFSSTNVFAFIPQKQKNKPKPVEQNWVDATLAQMTLDEKVGQLIIPAAVGMFMVRESDAYKEIERDITQFHVGGYHWLGDVTSLHEPAGVALITNYFQKLSKLPLFITADFEGGAGYRFIGATRLPRAMAMGATDNEELIFQAGRITAEESRAIGINVNFYPVVDVNNNARNPIINIRSFGSDPALVSRLARAYIRGLQSAGAMATAKHFPGHGDTSTDSHMELPAVDVSRERLDKIELPPFRAAVEEGVGGVMSAHIALPQITGDKTPATLAPQMLTDMLRKEMNFKGVIFTDALNMRGVAAHYPEGEAAARAVKAGADVILYPPSVEKAFNGIKQAVQSGEIKESRLDESVRRILSAKQKLGLDKNRFTDMEKLTTVLGNKEHQETAQKIIDSAITLVRDEKKVLPLKLKPEQKVLFISIVDNGEGWREYLPGRTFYTNLLRRHRNATSVTISQETSPAEFELIRKLAAYSDVVIVNAFIRIAAYKGDVDLTEGELNLLKSLSKSAKPFAFVMYGSPYLLSFVPELPTYVLAYEYYQGAEEAALKAVLGEIEFKGKLPIDLPGLYEFGHRIKP
ncbi:MAG: glycoside hydrolase family 3 N-terminal domain-containing protein [Acidobacteriota bacterium]